MTLTAGIDVGSTYTKVVLVEDGRIVGRCLRPTGFRLDEVAHDALVECLASAGRTRDALEYVVGTGMGRHQAAD